MIVMRHVRFCLPGSCGCTTIGVNAAHCAECRSFSSSLIDFSQKGKHNALLLTVSNRVWVDQWRHQRRAWGGRPPPVGGFPPQKKIAKISHYRQSFGFFHAFCPLNAPHTKISVATTGWNTEIWKRLRHRYDKYINTSKKVTQLVFIRL